MYNKNIGFIRVNRLNPVREASLCIHLLLDYVQSNLLELLLPLARLASHPRFQIVEWTVSIPEGPSGNLLRRELEQCGFVPFTYSEYCAQVESFLNIKIGVSMNDSKTDLGPRNATKDSSYDICTDCGEPFTLKTGEKIFFQSKGIISSLIT